MKRPVDDSTIPNEPSTKKSRLTDDELKLQDDELKLRLEFNVPEYRPLISEACKTLNLPLLKHCLKMGHDHVLDGELLFYLTANGLGYRTDVRGDVKQAKKMIVLLLEHGVNIKSVTLNEGSVLNFYTLRVIKRKRVGDADDAVDFLRFLIKQGADVNHQNINGQTPLTELFLEVQYDFMIWAYEDYFYEMIKYLLKAGANPNSVDNNGENPLLLHLNNVLFSDSFDEGFFDDEEGIFHERCEDFFDEIIVLLLSFGADDSINFVCEPKVKNDFVIKYSGAVTCRDVIIRRWGEGVYRLAERKRLKRMSKVVKDLEYLLCASQCESEDASFFREYRECVLDDEMVFVNNIIPMLNEMKM